MTAMVAVSLARMFNMDNTVGVAAGDRFELWTLEINFFKGRRDTWDEARTRRRQIRHGGAHMIRKLAIGTSAFGTLGYLLKFGVGQDAPDAYFNLRMAG